MIYIAPSMRVLFLAHKMLVSSYTGTGIMEARGPPLPE
jgi:hypothetical protein